MPSPLAQPAVWNAIAAGYAEDLIPVFEPYARDALRLADLPPDAHVLDVATGPGTLALLAAETAKHVAAVDFAPAMVAALEPRAAAAGNVTAVLGDGQALPFSDGRFDGAFSMFGLIFFPDPAAGFRELHRVLKPGGRAVVSSWAPMDGVPLLRACFGALGDHLPDFPFGERKAPFGDPDELRDAMAAAGFQGVEVHTVTHAVQSPSVRAFWATNERSSAPFALIREHLSAAEWATLGETVIARLEAEFGTGPVAMVWPARLAVGTRS